MTGLTDAQVETLNQMLTAFVPIFYFGKGYEGDSLKGIAWNGDITLTIENPWAGNTGYGSKSTISIDPAAARSLGIWLLAASFTQGGSGHGR